MNADELATARWFKSSKSNGQNNCVEHAILSDGRRAVRDTKDKGSGPVLIFTPAEWQAFIDGAKLGEFD